MANGRVLGRLGPFKQRMGFGRMSLRHHAQVNIPNAPQPGAVREYRMQVGGSWLAEGVQYVHLVAIDDPKVFVDTMIANPAAYLQVGQEYLIRVKIGDPITDDSLS